MVQNEREQRDRADKVEERCEELEVRCKSLQELEEREQLNPRWCPFRLKPVEPQPQHDLYGVG